MACVKGASVRADKSLKPPHHDRLVDLQPLQILSDVCVCACVVMKKKKRHEISCHQGGQFPLPSPSAVSLRCCARVQEMHLAVCRATSDPLVTSFGDRGHSVRGRYQERRTHTDTHQYQHQQPTSPPVGTMRLASSSNKRFLAPPRAKGDMGNRDPVTGSQVSGWGSGEAAHVVQGMHLA